MAEFKKRLTAPSQTDKGLISYMNGGFSTAKIMNKTNGSTMPNCVGYNYFRFCELNGIAKPDWRIPVGAPAEAIEYAKSRNLKVSTNPADFKLGAGIYWEGHEAMIEEIDREGNLTVSQSHARGTFFDTCVIKKADGYTYNGQKFLGYVFPDTDYGKGDFGKPEPIEDYSKNTIAERFIVKDKEGKKVLNTYTYWSYAVAYCDKVNGIIIDRSNGKIIYRVAESKPELTEKSYPDYDPATGKCYSVMLEPRKWSTSKGAFSYFKYALRCFKSNPGYHLYDANWNQLD